LLIGYNAVVTGNGDVQLGQATNFSGEDAVLNFRTQTVSNEAWIDGIQAMTIIDGSGNLQKDSTTGNVCLTGNLKVKGDLFVGNIFGASPITIHDPLFVQGNIFVDGTQVLGPQKSPIASLDDSAVPESPDGILVDTGNVESNANFKDVTEKLNMILDVLRAHGLIG